MNSGTSKLVSDEIRRLVERAAVGVCIEPDDGERDDDCLPDDSAEVVNNWVEELSGRLSEALGPWLTTPAPIGRRVPDDLFDELAELVSAAVSEFDGAGVIDEFGLVADLMTVFQETLPSATW